MQFQNVDKVYIATTSNG